jgi:hypothetical protein
MDEGKRDGEQWRGRGFLGKFVKGRGGAMVGRSPRQMQGIRSVRRRLDDEDLEDIFCNISSVMRSEIVSGGQHSQGNEGSHEKWNGSYGQCCRRNYEQDYREGK